MAMTTWKQRNGVVIEMRFMDSVHLVHAVNMVAMARPTPTIKMHPLHAVMNARGHRVIESTRPTRFAIPAHRETRRQLCVLNALLDHATAPLERPYSPEQLDHILSTLVDDRPEVYASYVNYLLTA